MRKWELTECGSGNAECGKGIEQRAWSRVHRAERYEFGSRNVEAGKKEKHGAKGMAHSVMNAASGLSEL